MGWDDLVAAILGIAVPVATFGLGWAMAEIVRRRGRSVGFKEGVGFALATLVNAAAEAANLPEDLDILPPDHPLQCRVEWRPCPCCGVEIGMALARMPAMLPVRVAVEAHSLINGYEAAVFTPHRCSRSRRPVPAGEAMP